MTIQSRLHPDSTGSRVDVRPSSVGRLPTVVVGLAALTALLRLPFMGAPMSADEGGFLVVAKGWHAGGGSLYGAHWVDRPPLLIGIFRVADALGGLTALRGIGCVAAFVTVLAVGATAHLAAGRRASVWGAAVAGVLLVAPTAGSLDVNGELLAAPFVAGGTALALLALRDRRAVASALAAAGAGACAVAAIMVKQNMLDVAVFAAVAGLVALRRGQVTRGRALRLGAFFAGGALDTLLVVVGAASVAGTNPSSLWFAMYPFRVQAATTMGHFPLVERLSRLEVLGQGWLATGAPLVLVALALLLISRSDVRRSPVPFSVPAAAVLALAAYGVGSVLAGGSYWSHYLVQLAVPTALAAGLVAAQRPRLGRTLAGVVVALSMAGWAVGLVSRTDAAGTVVGTAIGASSVPGDSVVSVLGSPDIVEVSGLPTPYRYPWSLPSRTLDPKLRLLAKVLRGQDAPTWVVVRNPSATALLQSHATGPVLARRYRLVGDVCGRGVYLRLDRPRPFTSVPTSCRAPEAPWFQHPFEIGEPR